MTKMVPARDSRVRTERTADGLRIGVVRRKTFLQMFMPVWAGVILGLGTVGMLAGDRPDYDAGAVIFLIVWFAIAVSVVLLSLWALLYREQLTLDSQALTHARWFGPIRFDYGRCSGICCRTRSSSPIATASLRGGSSATVPG